jgi:hippurate hydrolase
MDGRKERTVTSVAKLNRSPAGGWGEKLETKIAMLPESPGCYLMKDAEGTIIYVGKAVNLKNRVRSYFRDTEHTPKVAAMIGNIDDFDILLCDSNLEALCLECNLIKLHKPHYNILLKDDKHYPYLKVNLKEPFPRLELARRMNEKKENPWNILLVFQPAEETIGGAKLICETGVFEEHHVEAIFGLHLWPGLAAGQIFSRKEELMARASEINVDIYGKSAHIAKASEGVDAIAAGTEFYRRAMAMEASLPDNVFRLLKFGKFESGTVRNALSAHAHMEGSLRAFEEEVFEGLRKRIFEIREDVEEKFGCRIEIWMSEGYPAVMNPPEMVAQIQKIAPVKLLDKPSMTSEDFAEYQLRVPGVFFFLGTGDTAALHATTFNFDEEILLKGADFFEKLAENFQ